MQDVSRPAAGSGSSEQPSLRPLGGREYLVVYECDEGSRSSSVDAGLAFLYVLDELFQALPFRGVHIRELQAEVLPG